MDLKRLPPIEHIAAVKARKNAFTGNVLTVDADLGGHQVVLQLSESAALDLRDALNRLLGQPA